MSDFERIVVFSNKILKKFSLCDHCLGRLFSKQLNLSSNKLLGKRLNSNLNSNPGCYICKNIFSSLDHFLKLMLDSSSDYSFSTFNVGAIIKPSIVDRDDFIRSKYKLRGIDSVKTDITRELGKLFSRRTKKILDYLDPDVTLTLNLKEEHCQIRSKSIFLSGRYVKTVRNFPQKQKSCDNCLGKGCRMCDFHGISEFESVEGQVSKLLFEKFGGTTAKFTWIGGEDKSSLVLGTGRPFFVKIQNPLKRTFKFNPVVSKWLGIHSLRIISKTPILPLKFWSSVTIKISSKSGFDLETLKKLVTLCSHHVVVYDRSGKRSEKHISDVVYEKNSENMITLIIRVEGGLPIRRFVSGDDISPSISQLLDMECACEEFDFSDIEIGNDNK